MMSTNSQSEDHNAGDNKDMSFKKARLNVKLTKGELIEKMVSLVKTG